MSRNKDGYDIISNAGDRLTEYKKRCEVKGLIGIPTGIPKLDEIKCWRIYQRMICGINSQDRLTGVKTC